VTSRKRKVCKVYNATGNEYSVYERKVDLDAHKPVETKVTFVAGRLKAMLPSFP